MKRPITKILLALACAGTLAASASAQLPTTYTQGDFLLGFRQVGSQTNSVVVDLGPIANFTSASVYTINLGATLATQFGAGWASDANLFFSLAATSSTGNTNYVSTPQFLTGPDAGTIRVWTRLTNTNSNIFQGKINSLGSEFTSVGRVQPTTDPDAYSKFMPGGTNDAGHANGNLAWGYFNPTSEANFGQGTSGVALDLIQLQAGTGPGNNLGYFRLSADGNTLSYAPGAIPEPSTYAAVALGALVLLGFHINKTRKSSTKPLSV